MGLDKATIAKLDEKQLQQVIGGQANAVAKTSTGCGTGGSTC